MSGSIAFSPMQTTNFVGGFSIVSDGFVQGVAMDAPSVRNQLAGGVLASTETLPMWGGVALYEDVVGTSTATPPLPGFMGAMVGRATSVSQITAFSVFNQAHNMIQTTQSQVPTAQVGMSVNYYRIGTGARIPVAIDPALINTIGGALISTQVGWDFTLQRIIALSNGGTPLPVRILKLNLNNSKIVAYNTSTNQANWANASAAALILI